MKSKKSALTLRDRHADKNGRMEYKAIATLLEPFLGEVLHLADTSFEAIQDKYNLRLFVVKFETASFGDICLGDVCEIDTSVEAGESSIIFKQRVNGVEQVRGGVVRGRHRIPP